MKTLISLIVVIFPQCIMYQNIKLYTLRIYDFYVKNISVKLLKGLGDGARGVWLFREHSQEYQPCTTRSGKSKKELPERPLSFLPA